MFCKWSHLKDIAHCVLYKGILDIKNIAGVMHRLVCFCFNASGRCRAIGLHNIPIEMHAPGLNKHLDDISYAALLFRETHV